MINGRLLYLGVLSLAIAWVGISRMIYPLDPLLIGVLTAGGAALIYRSVCKEAGRIGVTFSVIVAQALLLPGWITLFSRWHEIPGLASLLALGANGLGLDSSVIDGRIVMNIGDLSHQYLPSLSRVGAFPLALVMTGMGAVIVLLPVSRPWRLFASLVFGLAFYAFVRTLLLMLGSVDIPGAGPESSIVWQLLSFAPAVLLMPRTITVTPEHSTETSSPLLPLGAAAVFGFAWVLALYWTDPGITKQGRILIDETHGVWEPTDTPFNTEQYGQQVSYAYSSLFELLDHHYRVTRLTSAPLNERVLDEADILVLKTPSEPYGKAEVDAIERFVHHGGGLFLIGDHTNLFGMSTYLNQVAGRFKLAFRSDDTFDVMTGGQSFWRPSPWALHPISRAIPEFEFETSCTIDAPLSARAPIIGYGLGAEPGDYGNPGFFGDIQLDESEDFGFFVQFATVNYGSGRVAAFSDSTTFSNFSLYFAGRAELLLATIDHLNRRSSWQRVIPLLMLIVGIAALTLLGGTRQKSRAGPMSAALSLGAAVGLWLTQTNGSQAELPKPDPDVPVMTVLRGQSELYLPGVLTLTLDGQYQAMDSFYVAAQRLGYRPQVRDEISDGIDGSDILLIVHPNRELDYEQHAAIARFVAAGGRLLILDGLIAPGTMTNHVLAPFGMRVTLGAVRDNIQDPLGAADQMQLLRPVITIEGGAPLLEDTSGNVVYAETPFGDGMVSVLVDSASLSKAALGNRFVGEPSKAQRASFETAYYVLGRLQSFESSAVPDLLGALD